MLSIFIMLIIAIGLCAGIGYGILTLIKSGEVSLGIQKNQARLENITASIRANLRYENGRILVPVDLESGTGSGALAAVPAISPFSLTAYGRTITYCPVSEASLGQSGGVSRKMIVDGVGTYDIKTVEAEGRHYVDAGSPGNAAGADQAVFDDLIAKGVVAYLISPDPGTDDVLRCENVHFPDEEDMRFPAGVETGNLTLLIQGGSVSPIFATEKFSVGQTFAIHSSPLSDGQLNALPASTRHFGSIQDAASYIGRYEVLDATLKLFEEEETISFDVLDGLTDKRHGRTVRLEGSAFGPVLLKVTGAGTRPVGVSGDFFASDIEFSAGSGSTNVVLAANASGRAYLHNVLVGGLHADGGEIVLSGDVSSVTPETSIGAPPVVVNLGKVSIEGAVGQTVFAPAANVVFEVNGGVLSVKGHPEVTAAPGSRLADLSGNARIEGDGDTVTFTVMRAGVPSVETLYPASRASHTQTCLPGGVSCEAECPAGSAEVVSGSCGSEDGLALSGFGESAGGNSYVCSWNSPIVTTATATATCR